MLGEAVVWMLGRAVGGMLGRLRSEERGFTIVEVLVAAVVLSTGLAGVVTLIDAASATDTTTKAREQGIALARELLEAGRSIPYPQLTNATIRDKVQAMPGLNNTNPQSTGAWQIQRRGFTYTVSIGTCAVDDPADGYGPEDPSLFCASNTGQPATPCKQLLDTGQVNGDANVVNSISGTLSGQLSIGLCGLDLSLNGKISDLVQADVAACALGACQNTPTTGDSTPDDYKRIETLVTWSVGGGLRYVVLNTAVTNPGQASGPHVTQLAVNLPPVPPAVLPPTVFTDSYTSLNVPFTASADSNATSVQWSLNGVPQGSATNVLGQWQFSWPIGVAGSGTETLDGNYSIGATAFDQNGNAGPPLSMTVTLNRRKPYPPKNFAGGYDGSLVDFQWAPNKEGDITGYQVYRNPGLLQQPVLACQTTNVRATTCQDTAPPTPPPVLGIQYYVVALDKDPAGNPRQGDQSTTLTVTTTNGIPTSPAPLLASTNSGNTVLVWNASTDPDGETIDFYRIYRDGQAVANRYDTAPGGSNTTYTDTQTGGVQHTYWVTAVDPQLAESPAAGPVTR